MENVQLINTEYEFSTNIEAEVENIEKMKIPSPTQLCLTLTVEETAEILGVSRTFAYEAVRRGEIPSVRIGRRILIPKVALERLLGCD